MKTIEYILNKYRNRIDTLDLELLIAHVVGKSREFILAHPEHKLTRKQQLVASKFISRRRRNEPLAYILGHKEFYGLNFKVNRNVLIPRPETELLVEETLKLLRSMLRSKLRNTAVVDVGTGSGNIMIAIVKQLRNLEFRISNLEFFATDISTEALKIARQNAKFYKIDKKIKFLEGDLLNPLFGYERLMKLKANELVIIANLPYLSKTVYGSSPTSVKKHEPRSALLGGSDGLEHYKKLFAQIKLLVAGYRLRVTAFIEISPEQRQPLHKMIKSILPNFKIMFSKDLAGRWRVCRIYLK